MNYAVRTTALAAGLMMTAGCGADGDRPGIIVMPGMTESVPYDAYDAHSVLGQTLRHPPEGAIPYGGSVFPYGPGESEAKRAGVELNNPVPSTKAELARGKVVFDRFCAVCHGPAGDGDGPIIGRFPNPPSLKGSRAKSLPDGELFHIISFGQGIMAPYAPQVKMPDRWRMVHYIRDLQGQWTATSTQAAPIQTSTVTSALAAPTSTAAAAEGSVK